MRGHVGYITLGSNVRLRRLIRDLYLTGELYACAGVRWHIQAVLADSTAQFRSPCHHAYGLMSRSWQADSGRTRFRNPFGSL